MNGVSANVAPLFRDDPTVWEDPLRSLGWTVTEAENGSGLALVMGDFEHEDRLWHTVAVGGGASGYPDSLIRWGWAQILGGDLHDLADGGVVIANGHPDNDVATRCLYVLFKVEGPGRSRRYMSQPRTVEGFQPGEVFVNGATVPAPGSGDGEPFGLYSRQAGGWAGKALMVSPHHLPTLPLSAARSLGARPRHNLQLEGGTNWEGLEGVYVRRLFGPDGLRPAAPPADADPDLNYWRMGANPTAQVVTRHDTDGTVLYGFVDPDAAERFDTSTIADHPNRWATLRELHHKISNSAPTQPPLSGVSNGEAVGEWNLCETTDSTVTFLFDNNMFPAGEVTAVVGPPKLGMKSWLGAELAASVATGRPLGALGNLAGQPRRVLYLTNETTAGQKRRIDDQIARLSRPETTGVDFSEQVTVGTGRFTDGNGRVRYLKLGDGSIPKMLIPWAVANDVGLIVFDTLLTYLPGTGHGNYWELGELIQELVDLAAATAGAVVYMHHTPRGGSARQLGSQALDGKVAQTLLMTRDSPSVPRVSATVLSRLFTPVTVPISFQIDTQPDGSGLVHHLNGDQPDDVALSQRVASMMEALRSFAPHCHAITRTMMVDAFTDAFRTGHALGGQGPLNSTSQALRKFLLSAKKEGWLIETGKRGNAKHYKLDTCDHVTTLLPESV